MFTVELEDAWLVSIPILVGIVAFWKNWLTLEGSLLGVLLSSGIVMTGAAETSALLVFFLIGTFATKYSKKVVSERTEESKGKKERFSVISYESSESKGRNASQVLATAGVPFILCVGMLSELTSPELKGKLGSMFFAYFACDLADTMASEFGVLSKRLPTLLTTLKPVPRGTDGAISFEGTLASLIGGVLIGFCAYFSSSVSLSLFESCLKYSLVGLLGCTLDSLLGCVIQPQVIMSKHPHTWKTANNFVNLASGMLTLLVDILFQLYFWPSVMISLVLGGLLLLFISPISEPMARKALHIGVGAVIMFASRVGQRNLIACVALIASFVSLPQLNLDTLWERFKKNPSSQKSKAKDSGIFFFALTTGFIFYHFPSNVAESILFPMYFADPVAAIAGRALSTKKQTKRELKPIVSKSTVGTFSFFLVQLVGQFFIFSQDNENIVFNCAIAANLALVELLSGSLDNLLLPIAYVFLAGVESSGMNGFSRVELVAFFACAVGAHCFLFNANYKALRQGVDAFWRFSRPHTIIGTSLSITVVMTVTLFHQSTGITFSGVYNDPELFNLVLSGLLLTIASSLQANVYIVGLNEMYDIEIDIINKPYLPVASGEFTEDFGWAVVLTCFVCSTLNAFVYGNTKLLYTVCLGNLMGTVYSVHLPFLHWKRFPLLAAALIFMVRGGLVQIGFAEYTKELVNENSLLKVGHSLENEYVVFLCVFLTVFGVAIAMFKDVPDIAGDEEEGIRTFAVQFGAQKVVNVVNFMLFVVYSGAAYFWYENNSMFGMVAHLLVFALLGNKLNGTVVTGKEAAGSIRSSYMAIWKAFYVEYVLVAAMFVQQRVA